MFDVIGGFDKDGDGKVSFGEFVQALWKTQNEDEINETMALSQSM